MLHNPKRVIFMMVVDGISLIRSVVTTQLPTAKVCKLFLANLIITVHHCSEDCGII